MKASELISLLQQAIAQVGDLSVVGWSHCEKASSKAKVDLQYLHADGFLEDMPTGDEQSNPVIAVTFEEPDS